MTDDIDFAALYGELGLRADCSMALFKQAYRRRVRELHPDLAHAQGSIGQLQRLNQLYAAAIDFDRAHGRLPGAPRVALARMAADPMAHATAAEEPTSRTPAPATTTPDPTMAGSRPWLRYIVLLGLVGIVLLWLPPREPSEPELQTSVSNAPSADHVQAAQASTIGLGMDGTQVLRLQGAPLNDDDTHLDYGPSWIDLRCGKVSDWYSSPLRPLRVSTTRPSAADIAAAHARKSPGC
ncbi:MAG: hypothetical protein ACOH1R_00355 [Luteimonas sp.]